MVHFWRVENEFIFDFGSDYHHHVEEAEKHAQPQKKARADSVCVSNII